MNIRLKVMTKELARQYFSRFELDPSLFSNPEDFRPYVYSPTKSDETVDRYAQLGRVYLAVMLDEEPIGEVVLKKIDRVQRHCTLGISLRSDEYKNNGYGTEAEILTLKYAFDNMGMETVYADSLLSNLRSRHVLEKVGFHETGRDDEFVYYRCDKAAWKPCKELDPSDQLP